MGLDTRKPVFGVCEQKRRRPACASAQSGQRHCYSLIGKDHMNYLNLSQANFQYSRGDRFEYRFVANPEYWFLATNITFKTRNILSQLYILKVIMFVLHCIFMKKD